jgi:hypothetical protein
MTTDLFTALARRPRVVIVGGGFGGLRVARGLRHARRRSSSSTGSTTTCSSPCSTRWPPRCCHPATSRHRCGRSSPTSPTPGWCWARSGLEKSSRSALNWSLWVVNAPWEDRSRRVAAGGRLLDERVSWGWTRPSGCLGADEVGKAGTIGELGLTLRRGNEQSPVGRVPRRIRVKVGLEEVVACSFSDWSCSSSAGSRT